MAKRRLFRLEVVVVFSWLFLPLVFLIQAIFGEANWLVFASMGVCQELWCVPALLATFACLVAKRWKLAIVSIVALVAGVVWAGGFRFGSGGGSEQTRLRVMTFNVEKFAEHSVDDVVAAIRREHPDVVCLQEAAKLPPPFRAPEALHIPGYRTISDGEIAILSRLPVLGQESVSLEAGPSSRPLLLVRVQVGGREVTVASIHYQFFPWDEPTVANIQDAAAIRARQRTFLSEFVRTHEDGLVLCGDFNSLPNAPIIRTLSGLMTDSFAATGFGFGWTVPAGIPLRRLDYIFVGSGLRPLRSFVSGSVVSDHRAVLAEIALQ